MGTACLMNLEVGWGFRIKAKWVKSSSIWTSAQHPTNYALESSMWVSTQCSAFAGKDRGEKGALTAKPECYNFEGNFFILVLSGHPRPMRLLNTMAPVPNHSGTDPASRELDPHCPRSYPCSPPSQNQRRTVLWVLEAPGQAAPCLPTSCISIHHDIFSGSSNNFI